MSEFAILIPAYNAEHSIPELLKRIRALECQPAHIVLVDDGSRDNTASLAAENGAKVIRLPKNSGKGRALRTGFSYYLDQKYDGNLLCLDADLQHLPETIPLFLDKVKEQGSRVIIGNRDKSPGKMPLHRILSNRITSGIISLLARQRIPDSQCGFRLIHTDVIRDLDLREDGFQLESEFILKIAKRKIRIDFVTIPVIYSGHGSHIGNVRDTIKFVKLIIRFLLKKQ